MSDLISREAAIDALGDKPLAWTEGEYELGLQNQWQSDVDTLKALPSAQPETERATWALHTYMPHNYYCTHCKKDSPYNKTWRYCPNCGCEMEGSV